MRNPDLREGMYNARIAQQETRRALLKLFPGLSFNYGFKHSNDDFLIHQPTGTRSAHRFPST
jgi:outer membrane protein TolC